MTGIGDWISRGRAFYGTLQHSADHVRMKPGSGAYGVPLVLAQSAVPVAIAQTGTMAANGAVTLGTSLPATFSGGIWLYFPAGKVYAGSTAGFYWTVMSSATAGTVYDVKLSGIPSVPAAPTAITAAGPGAFTGDTGEQTLASITVPGGLMGANGALRVRNRFSMTGSTNSKTVNTKLSTTAFMTQAITAAASVQAAYLGSIQNCGVQTIQVGEAYSSGVGLGAGAGTLVRGQVNTAADQTLAITATRATATEFLVLESLSIEVLPAS